MLRNLRNRGAEANSSSADGAAQPDGAGDETKASGLPVVREPDSADPVDSTIRGRLNRVTRYATHNHDNGDAQAQESGEEDPVREDPGQQHDGQNDKDSEQDAMALTDEVIEESPEDTTPEVPEDDTEAEQAPIILAAPVDDDVAPEDQILTVGRGIRLAAEVCECDTLVVEGQFEAKAKARLLQVSARGAFKGEAEVAEAEISGGFDGKLTVTGRLTIHGDATVVGSIEYGEVVVEAGGQIGGEVACMTPRQVPAGVKVA